MDLKNVDLFLFDLDGTLYIGDGAIEGAPRTAAALRAAGKKVCFLTNNSSKASGEYIAKLKRIGFEPKAGEFCCSAFVTIDYLKRRKYDKRVYLLAPAAVRREFACGGIDIIGYGENKELQITNYKLQITNKKVQGTRYKLQGNGQENQDNNTQLISSGGDNRFMNYTVVVGFDTELVYDNLRTACMLLDGGARFIATHPDITCPAPGGFIPDVGGFLKMIAAVTGRKPSAICGKPFRIMSDYIMKQYGITDPRRVLMVGDRLSTDIKFGLNNGFKTAAVLTGEITREAIEKSKFKPDFVLESVNDLFT